MSYSAIIDYNGELYTCGDNQYGQLGLADPRIVRKFTRIPTNLPVLQVSCSKSHTAVITTDNRLHTCGYDGIRTLTRTPTDLRFLQVVCTNSETLALGTDNNIYGCGDNGVVVNKELTLMPSDARFLYISASGTHTVAISEDGDLYGCGNNDYGQLCLSNLIEFEVKYRASDSLMTNLTRLSSDIQFKQVACGDYYTMAISEDGDLYGCGNNNYGQLGVGDYDARTSLTHILTELPISQVSCGKDYTVIVSEDGHLYTCGNNACGQLGVGDCNKRNSLTHIPTDLPISQVACGNYVLVLDEANNLYVCGYNYANHLRVNGYNCDDHIHPNTTRFITTLTLLDSSINGEISALMNNPVLAKPRIKSALSGY